MGTELIARRGAGGAVWAGSAGPVEVRSAGPRAALAFDRDAGLPIGICGEATGKESPAASPAASIGRAIGKIGIAGRIAGPRVERIRGEEASGGRGAEALPAGDCGGRERR